jgi:hypothetical protein
VRIGRSVRYAVDALRDYIARASDSPHAKKNAAQALTGRAAKDHHDDASYHPTISDTTSGPACRSTSVDSRE